MEQRQRHGEARAFAEAFAFGSDLAVMEIDDVSGDGQAEAEAAALAGVGLAEALEHVREERRVDPLALIGHADPQLPVSVREAVVHLPATRRELDRVREDVPREHPRRSP